MRWLYPVRFSNFIFILEQTDEVNVIKYGSFCENIHKLLLKGR